MIDFACGTLFGYVSVQEVISRARERPDELARLFEGKIVLVGKVGPDEDPVRQPLSLAAWAPDAPAPPGVVLIAQSIRALQSGRILSELPLLGVVALVALARQWSRLEAHGGPGRLPPPWWRPFSRPSILRFWAVS